MARRDWVGNYDLTYKVYYSYKNEWVRRTVALGHCLSRDEAISKAVAFMTNSEEMVKPIYISDGFGNRFTA